MNQQYADRLPTDPQSPASESRDDDQPLPAAMNDSPDRQKREERAESTKRAIAELMRAQIARRKLHQKTCVRNSGVSRTHLQSLLRAEKQMSLFIFLELSEALKFDDPCQLLMDVLSRREQLLAATLDIPMPQHTPASSAITVSRVQEASRE